MRFPTIEATYLHGPNRNGWQGWTNVAACFNYITSFIESVVAMQREEAARGFAAMGSEARLRVLRILIRAGGTGLNVSEIQDRTGIAPSTLAHHLKFLTGAGLLAQARVGRAVVTRADYDQLRGLAEYILTECCADETGTERAANDG